MYGFLADVLVFIHCAYIGYVVLGQLAIWLGWPLGWTTLILARPSRPTQHRRAD